MTVESSILKSEIQQLEIDKQELQSLVNTLTEKLQSYSWGKSKQEYYKKNKQLIIDRNRERRHKIKSETQTGNPIIGNAQFVQS